MPANDKPYPGFPLFRHASGQWAKKIRGKLYYFGIWADWEAALKKFLKERDDLYAGRTPCNGDGLTVRQLVNRFLTHKKRLVESRELQPRTFQDYHDDCERILKVRACGDELPEGEWFTIYRGVAGPRHTRRVRAFSWTLDLDKARWFATRLNLADPAVYMARVRRGEVLAYDDGRQEKEVICRPRSCKLLENLTKGAD